jgi:hypothetical protein
MIPSKPAGRYTEPNGLADKVVVEGMVDINNTSRSKHHGLVECMQGEVV